MRLWLPLQMAGVAAFRAAQAEKLALARYFHARLSEIDGLDPGPPPDLSVVAFRYLPKTGDVDEFNERLMQHIQQEGRVMMSGTKIDGSYRLRCAILCFRTHLEHVDDASMRLFAAWRRSVAEVVAETERLRLRAWDDDDEFRFYDVMNTPAVMRWLGGLRNRRNGARAISACAPISATSASPSGSSNARRDGEILGFCGLKRANAPGADAIAGEFEIGWRLREDAWGQGYAKEAAIAPWMRRSIASQLLGWWP